MAKTLSRKKAGRRAFEANILDGLADAVILIDNNRTFVDGNEAAMNLLGSNVQGQDLAGVVNSAEVIEAVDNVLSGKAIERGEVHLPAPVSRICEMQVIDLPARNPDKPDWVMLVLRDITDARKAEQMRADFVSNVSHELRSPISSLLGFIETLQGPARDDPQARERFLGIMEEEARRMTRLVNDLLTLSKVEAAEHIRPREAVDLAQLLGEISTVLTGQGKSRDMQIALTVPDDLPAVAGDKEELIQVFRNLIDNALKYGDQGSVVQITASPSENNSITTTIVNHGPGIQADDIPRLTERFYRADKGRSRASGGTGLGLAIVKHIIGRHRGQIEISSVLGETTSVSVSLPVLA